MSRNHFDKICTLATTYNTTNKINFTCMPNKPIKRGIKLWIGADSSNGYTAEFQVYAWKKDARPEKGLGYRIVYDLTRKLVGKHFQIFCDNFFTSCKAIK